MTKDIDVTRRSLLAGAGIAAVGAAAAPKVAFASQEAIDLSGKSILITGTSSGFGKLMAEHFARLGGKVFATMRNVPRPEAEELQDLASDEGLDLTVLEIDVLSDAQVEAGVGAALSATDGKLDVLINNAGIAMAGPTELQDMDATTLMFDTNTYGPHRLTRAALPSMRAAGSGQIINVSSQLGRLVIPGFGQYSASKFALEAMSEQLAYEVVSQGIEVTVVQPGGYPTEIWANQVALSGALKDRLPADLLEAYPAMAAGMGVERGNGGGDTDPMDIPRAVAELIAMPAGTRPLRKAVHPIARPQLPINEVSAQQQLAFLGEGPFGPLVRAVLK